MRLSPRSFALWAIVAYQRFVSPYKGFCCAYAFHTGHASCSTLGYRAIRRRGIPAGNAILTRLLQQGDPQLRQIILQVRDTTKEMQLAVQRPTLDVDQFAALSFNHTLP